MKGPTPEDIAAEWRTFAEWGLPFRPEEVVAGSVTVSTDEYPSTVYGFDLWETAQSLKFHTVDEHFRVVYEYRRRWMGDSWGEPVKTGERRALLQ